jgi:hypothetical protein
MPWYLVEAHHGPGHQSNTSEIYWSDKALDKKGKEDLWDRVFKDGNREYDWPIGNVYRIKGITQHYRDSLISNLEDKIARATSEIVRLKGAKIIEHSPIGVKPHRLCVCGKMLFTCERCGKELCYSFKSNKRESCYQWCAACNICGDSEVHSWDYKHPPVKCTKCGVEHPSEKWWAKNRK